MHYNKLAAGVALTLAHTLIPVDLVHAQSGRGAALEEIIVTAQRREASLQETDISMSVFSDRTLRELGVLQYQDVGDFAPNVVIHEAVGNAGSAVMMRGLKNAETLVSFEPKVSVYLDGVLISKNTGSAFDIVDLERVEVLRGPQGTLYGRNTVGGAINLISKRPTDVLEGRVAITLGDYNQRDFRGTVNVPLVGANGVLAQGTDSTLSLKATLASLNRDGYWENFGPSGDTDLGDKNREAAHVQLQWQPSDSTTLLYTYDSTTADEKAVPRPATHVNPAFINAIPYLQETAKYVVSDTHFDTYFDFPQVQELDVEGHSLTAEIDLSENLSLVSITAVRETENTALGDSDGTPLLLRGSVQDSSHEQLTQELRLVGTAWDDSLKYVVGAFYMDEEGESYNGNVLPATTDQNLINLENEIWAVFGEGTYSLTERLDLTLGVRYTEEKREMSKQTFAFPTGAGYYPDTGDAPIIDADAANTWEDISGTVSLSYQWTDDLMTYAKVAKGYASGGFNGRAATADAFRAGYDEETVISYELGWKSTWFDNRLLVNGAVFQSDYSDLLVNQFDPVLAVNNLSNAGDAVIKGWEAEFMGQVTDNLEVGGSYGYIDPDYETFIAANGQDLSKSFWAHTPQHNMHLYVRYEIPGAVAGGDLSGRIDWMYQDDINFLTLNPIPWGEPHYQKAYDHANARLSLDNIQGFGNGTLDLALWVKNLTDESWRTTGINFVLYGVNSWAPPRTWGVDLNYSF